jgi:hypothetical protein
MNILAHEQVHSINQTTEIHINIVSFALTFLFFNLNSAEKTLAFYVFVHTTTSGK